jgi:hypothetical protein
VRSTFPIKSAALAKVDGVLSLVLSTDESTHFRNTPTVIDGTECLTANQIVDDVGGIVDVTVNNELLPREEALTLPVVISADGAVEQIRSVVRKLVNPRNARLCLMN